MITGAAGGIGSTLSLLLMNKGHKVYAVDNLNNGYMENLFENNRPVFEKFFKEDIRDTKKMIDIIYNENIEKIIHLAAITALPVAESDPCECMSVNVAGTASILDAAKLFGIHTIVASTSAIYENNKITDSPFIEDISVNPLLMYPLSKKLMENIVESYIKNYGMNITTLRFFNVFGPRQDIHRKTPPLVNYIVREIKNGRDLVFYSDGKQQRDYVHVDDVVNMIELCLTNDNAKNQTFNLCTNTLTSVKDIIGWAKDAFDTDFNYTFIPAKNYWSEYNNLHYGINTLDKSVIEREVNKYALGSFIKAYKMIGWDPNRNIRNLMIDTMRKNYEHYSK